MAQFCSCGSHRAAAGYSYVKLAIYYDEGGGEFIFLLDINADGLAGSLSWVLIVGYLLTNAEYAFTFDSISGTSWISGPGFHVLLALPSWFCLLG